MRKICSACGKDFECLNTGGGCWCEKLPHVMPMNPDSDCLCEICLRKVIAAKLK